MTDKRRLKLNYEQVRLVQTAVRKAGIRLPKFDGRYYMVLAQYKTSEGKPVKSCRDLNRWQMEDLLAICETLGWRHPGKSETYYRDRINAARQGIKLASFAQTEVIRLLAGDLGMDTIQLNAFIKRMTDVDNITVISSFDAWKITEALKAMLSRKDGRNYETVADVAATYKKDTEVATNGKEQTHQKTG